MIHEKIRTEKGKVENVEKKAGKSTDAWCFANAPEESARETAKSNRSETKTDEAMQNDIRTGKGFLEEGRQDHSVQSPSAN